MSATISLKHALSRQTGAALRLVQHGWVIGCLILIFVALSGVVKGGEPLSEAAASEIALPERDAQAQAEALPPPPPTEAVVAAVVEVLPAHLQAALDSVARRYRVSADALKPIFSLAQRIGSERHLDPLLIVAVIGVESRFNPFAESVKGAQGLMQVMPRFHLDKVPEGAGEGALLDPAINIRVGVEILKEAIRRNGGLEAGLQSYAGSPDDPESLYANRVFAEKERLEQAPRPRV